MSRFCENCGARLNDGAKFCSECGRRLNRWNYFKRMVLTVLIETVAIFVLAVVLAILVPNEVKNSTEIIATAMFILVIALNAYLTYGLIIRRCHDLRQNSLLHTFISKDDTYVAKFIIAGSAISGIIQLFELSVTIGNLVDILIGIVSLYVLFAPGENGANEYGEVD